MRDWVTDRPDGWAQQIQIATIDAFRGYATAIGDVLPDATLVIDHFHAIRLASACVDDVRRRVPQDTLGHRGHKADPFFGIRRLLLRTWDHLTDRGGERLRAGLSRELLVEVYAVEDLAHTKRRLIVFFQHAADAELPELSRLAATIDAWRDEILAFRTTSGANNGPTEAVNLIIEKLRRHRPRLPQLQQLSTPTTPRLRHQMDYRPNTQNPRPPSSICRVEPLRGARCLDVYQR